MDASRKLSDMLQINRILCPVDFSEFSQHALDHAIAIARTYGSCITVLNVFPIAIPADPFAGLAGFQPVTLEESQQEQLIAYVKEFASREAGYPLHCVVREGADVHAEILAAAAEIDPDLIVMGTHGRSGFQHLALGSVAEKVLRKANCPVLTVPPKTPDAVPAGPLLYRRVMCGIDFSECSLLALEYAQSVATRFKGRLDVVTVVQPIPSWESTPTRAIYPDLINGLQADAKKRLDELLSESKAHGAKVEGIVAVGTPHHEIVRLAAERNTELIVLGVHGHGVVDRIMFGSTSNHVVREARCPVLTVRTESQASRAHNGFT
jgi:nucleotide-binding universal stress UspA family protein